MYSSNSAFIIIQHYKAIAPKTSYFQQTSVAVEIIRITSVCYNLNQSIIEDKELFFAD